MRTGISNSSLSAALYEENVTGLRKICEPKFNSTLSDSQLRVMELCYYGKKDEEIAETLFISSHTVKNHRKNVFLPSIQSMAEFMRYANEKNLFKGE